MNKLRFGAVLMLLTGLALGSPEAGEKKTVIAGIIFMEDTFFRLCNYGMKDAALAAGCEYLEGNSNNRPEKEISLVDTYVARRVDAICIAPVSETASLKAMENAAAKGVKISLYGTPSAYRDRAPYVESSPYKFGVAAGRAARKFITEKLNGKAKIGILAFASLIPEESNARRNGFMEQLRDLPGVELVAEQDAWLPEAALKKANDILTANPDLDILYGANEGGTVGAVLAVKATNRVGKCHVFGIDANEQIFEALKSPDNILQATVSDLPYELGKKAVENALALIRGEKVDMYTEFNGILLTRERPDEILSYEENFKKLIGRD